MSTPTGNFNRFESEEDLGNAEHVDVGVVEGEVDDDQPCGAVDPQTLSQFLHRRHGDEDEDDVSDQNLMITLIIARVGAFLG